MSRVEECNRRMLRASFRFPWPFSLEREHSSNSCLRTRKDNTSWTAHRHVLAGERKSAPTVLNAKHRNAITALIARVQITANGIDGETARIIGTSPRLPACLNSPLAPMRKTAMLS